MLPDVLHKALAEFSIYRLEGSIAAPATGIKVLSRAGWMLRRLLEPPPLKALAWSNKLRQPCPTTSGPIPTSSQDNTHTAHYQFTLKLPVEHKLPFL